MAHTPGGRHPFLGQGACLGVWVGGFAPSPHLGESLVPRAEDPEGWRLRSPKQLWVVGRGPLWLPRGRESLCAWAGCTPGPCRPRTLHKGPLLLPKPLMELLWNCLPKSQGRIQGSKTISIEHVFSFSIGTFVVFFNQHHTMLPKAMFRLSWITTVKYYSCTVPNLALACSDKTLHVFCKA